VSDVVAAVQAPSPIAQQRWGLLTGAEIALGQRSDRPRVVLASARVMFIAGVVAILFLAYEFLLSGVLHDRAQEALLSTFRLAVHTTTLDAPASRLAEGAPVAILDLPRLGSPMVVVEGTSPQDLKSGPGHLRVSPVPGEFGNSVIAGRRATYGGPFGKLDQLHRGDVIKLTTGQGIFTYKVSSTGVARAGDAEPLTGTLDSRLTLVTSDPVFGATRRLVVVAKLQGAPLAVPTRPASSATAADLGLALNAVWLAVAAAWALTLAAAIVLATRLRRLWPRSVVLMFAVPVTIGLSVLLFSSFDLVLPGML
jgi:LPXTG-site transpeptidase (sortase) family protein